MLIKQFCDKQKYCIDTAYYIWYKEQLSLTNIQFNNHTIHSIESYKKISNLQHNNSNLQNMYGTCYSRKKA